MNATSIRNLQTAVAGAIARRVCNRTVLSLVAGICLSASPALAASSGIVPPTAGPSVLGFETSEGYSTTFDGDGKLEGQVPVPSFNATWFRETNGTGASSAVIQSGVVNGGTQAVQVDRGANSDDRWAIQAGVSYDGAGTPTETATYPNERFICIEWDMRVDQTASNSFGPVFGIEAYDEQASVERLGSLFVDATTADVLYQQAGTGFLTETGVTATFGDWHSYGIQLDYLTQEYSVFFEGTLLLTEDFIDENSVGPFDGFTDADIAALAGAPGSVAQGLTGTAYFDNFSVFETSFNKVPEPSTIILAGIGIAVLAFRRKSA